MTANLDERDRALAKLESLLAAAPVGIAFVDLDLRIRRLNDALVALVGHNICNPIGRSLDDVIPELAAALQPMLRHIVESGRPVLELELAVNAKRTCVAHFFPVHVGESIIGVGAMLVDITERKQFEEQLRNAVQVREDVLAVVSHDLRSPVATIHLTSTMLAHTLGQDARAHKHIEVLKRSIAQLQHLLDDLVDSVNIRAGRISLELGQQSVEAVITEAVELHEPIATQRAIDIERAAAVQGLKIHCDHHRILQVFGNLIGNALKFCRAGDTIRVSADKLADEVIFAVRDTGPGIDEAHLASLFHPHHTRVKKSKNGSGLGLHICKGIVEHHGGRIWIESQLGMGTTVYFTLPLAT